MNTQKILIQLTSEFDNVVTDGVGSVVKHQSYEKIVDSPNECADNDVNVKSHYHCMDKFFHKMSLQCDQSPNVDDSIEKAQKYSTNSLTDSKQVVAEIKTVAPMNLSSVVHAMKLNVDDDDLAPFSRFNENQKWKQLAIALHYEDYVHCWEKLQNPIRALLIFAKVKTIKP